MDRTDCELLIRFRDGDLEAFDEIVRRFEGRLVGYFFSLGGDRDVAEDLAQETFLRLFGARHRYRPDAPFQTFVFRIARNLWIDRYRALKWRPAEHSLEASGGDQEGGLAAGLASEERSPDEVVADREELERLRRALSRLPERHRAVLALAAGQGLRYAEVAEILDIPVGTVKSRVFAAVRQLRRLLKTETDPDEAPARNEDREGP